MGNFTVKDSGKRETFATGMVRDTEEGKPNYLLIVPKYMKENMLKRWATHMTLGAKKYGIRNWEKACTQDELFRFKSSAFRHFMQWIDGMQDEDHAAAVFFNIQATEYLKERMVEGDTK